MIFHLNAYFVSCIFWLKNGNFDFQYLNSKYKIYVFCQKMKSVSFIHKIVSTESVFYRKYKNLV